jgi:hypothetical protein
VLNPARRLRFRLDRHFGNLFLFLSFFLSLSLRLWVADVIYGVLRIRNRRARSEKGQRKARAVKVARTAGAARAERGPARPVDGQSTDYGSSVLVLRTARRIDYTRPLLHTEYGVLHANSASVLRTS